MEQVSSAPTNKVLMGALAVALTVIIVWAIKQFASTEIPPEVASAFTVITTAITSYLVPPAARDRIAQNP